MAYTIHITKKQDWADEEPKITKEELDALIEKGVLESVGDQKHPSPWDAKKGNLNFYFTRGNINCNPREEKDIQKIKEIASVIGAKVQGDEGEIY